MGVFSSSQFVGAFLGGLLGGLAHEQFGGASVYLVGMLTSLLWLRLVWTLPIPENLSRHVIALGTSGATLDVSSLEQRLLEVPGVKEAVIVLDEGVAYLKVDSRQTDWARLQTFSAGA
jgi:MFS family permease